MNKLRFLEQQYFSNIFRKILFLFFLNFSSSVLAEDKMILGLEVYNNKAQCGVCHILKAAESSGDVGPNLDELKPTEDQIIYVVTNGIGVMPPWDGILSKKEIEAVAHYVFNSTNK